MSAAAPALPREEFLASFCFVLEDRASSELAGLTALADTLEAAFRYWEIVYVAPERCRGEIEAAADALARIKNLRIIMVGDEVGYYRRRAVAASEAIGDVVVLSTQAEAARIDLPALAAGVYEGGGVVLARRQRTLPSLSPVYGLLALLSSYRVSDSDLQTIALPRTRLNAFLLRSTLALDLRFEPKRGAEHYRRQLVRMPRPPARKSGLADRYELLEVIISTSAPRYLKGYAALSAAVALLAMLYGVYAVLVGAFKPDVQPGWFSTAIVQSGSVSFVAIGFAVLGIGLAELAERLSGGSRHAITDEIANISFFGERKQLNVEVDAGSDELAP